MKNMLCVCVHAPVHVCVCVSQDLANALKLVHERCGQEFEQHVMTVAAPAAGLPPALAEQLVAVVRLGEGREIRDALRSLLTQAQAAGRGGGGGGPNK